MRCRHVVPEHVLMLERGQAYVGQRHHLIPVTTARVWWWSRGGRGTALAFGSNKQVRQLKELKRQLTGNRTA